jgi:hypothetical protein
LGDEFAITVSGPCHRQAGTLSSAAVVTAYDSAEDAPTTWVYMHLWADQDCYVQVISAAASATFKVAAEQPFVLPGFGKVLAAASTTAISGGAEPAVAAVAKVVIGNYSGSTMNYILTIVN